jgi:hypothetical protein
VATFAVTVETICSGLGHWRVRASLNGQAVAEFAVDFEALQAGADPREFESAALALLKAACAGKTIQDVEPILLAGIEVVL